MVTHTNTGAFCEYMSSFGRIKLYADEFQVNESVFRNYNGSGLLGYNKATG